MPCSAAYPELVSWTRPQLSAALDILRHQHWGLVHETTLSLRLEVDLLVALPLIRSHSGAIFRILTSYHSSVELEAEVKINNKVTNALALTQRTLSGEGNSSFIPVKVSVCGFLCFEQFLAKVFQQWHTILLLCWHTHTPLSERLLLCTLSLSLSLSLTGCHWGSYHYMGLITSCTSWQVHAWHQSET